MTPMSPWHLSFLGPCRHYIYNYFLQLCVNMNIIQPGFYYYYSSQVFFFLILKEIKLNTFVFVHRNPVAVVASGSVSPGRAPP